MEGKCSHHCAIPALESSDAYLASPADFAGADDIITNLAKEREPGDIECAPQSLIITSTENTFANNFPIFLAEMNDTGQS